MKDTDARIRILVADDHPVVRDGLVAMLRTQPDFDVVGEAGNGAEAVREASSSSPDVMLVDIEMPVLDGIAVIQQVKAHRPATRVVVFTAFDRNEQIVGALRAGADGYLLKGARREEVFRAIRTAHAGGSLIEPLVASKLVRQMREGDALADTLTAREQEVLGLVAAGRSNRAIARALGISERTAKFHVSSILLKLHAANRTEAVAAARERGWLA